MLYMKALRADKVVLFCLRKNRVLKRFFIFCTMIIQCLLRDVVGEVVPIRGLHPIEMGSRPVKLSDRLKHPL